MSMELILTVQSGDEAGRRIVVPAGKAVCIGRSPEADVRLPADPMLSALHFEVSLDDQCSRIRDRGSRFGTLLNGIKVAEAELHPGDEIRAGRSIFQVSRAGEPQPGELASVGISTPAPVSVIDPPRVAAPLPVLTPETRPLSDLQLAVLHHLNTQSDPLFALLDAAREPSVVGRLERSQQEFQCLYDGDKGEEFSAFGPWLVRLSPEAEVLKEIVREGWGQSWGVYLTASLSLSEVRKHLRKFLIAKLPDGRQVYFRFYDPRVLRTYLPTCTTTEVANFVGPIKRFLVESVEGKEILEFAGTFRDWRKVGVG